jgi:hypothetical protein
VGENSRSGRAGENIGFLNSLSVVFISFAILSVLENLTVNIDLSMSR